MELSKKTQIIFLYSIIIMMLVIPTIHKTAMASDALILAVHPYLPAEELLQKFTPLANYLSAHIGKSTASIIGRNH